MPHKVKIFTCGNHDFSACTAKNFYETRGRQLNAKYNVPDSPDDVERTAAILNPLTSSNPSDPSLVYLDSSAYEFTVDTRREVRHHVWKVYGSPWSPEFENWAWNYTPPEARSIYQNMPQDVDVLITHTPPHGLGGLDRIHNGTPVGCEELTRRLTAEREDGGIRPLIHVFGHIHEARGVHLLERKEERETVLVNAALVEYDQEKWVNHRVCKYQYDTERGTSREKRAY